MSDEIIKWSAKLDVFRPTTDFADLLRIVACYYEMFSKAATFLGPWIAKQNGIVFLSPSKEQVDASIGNGRGVVSSRVRSSFIEALLNFLMRTKGKKTLITPSPTSHHSAQFTSGTFNRIYYCHICIITQTTCYL